MPKKPVESTPCVVRWNPINAAQRKVQALWATADILFLLGPAGSGKTLAAVAMGANDVANDNRMRLVGLRPAVECGKTLGFLPGSLEEKLAPFATPTLQALAKVSFRFPMERLSFDAVAYLRGVTYEHSIVLVDEAQNLSSKELKLVLTRLGRGSKMIVLGDPEQCDITTEDGYTDLEVMVDRLEGIAGVGVVDFQISDVVRHPTVARILRYI